MLATLGEAHDDLGPADFCKIERMKRLAQFKEHVIGDIDDVVDGANADGFEALAQPSGRRTDFHAADEPGGVMGAKIRRIDAHFDRGLGGLSGFGRRNIHILPVSLEQSRHAAPPAKTGTRTHRRGRR